MFNDGLHLFISLVQEIKRSAIDSNKLGRSMKDLEAEHKEFDYNDPEFDGRLQLHLTKILEILDNFNEKAGAKDQIIEDRDRGDNYFHNYNLFFTQ